MLRTTKLVSALAVGLLALGYAGRVGVTYVYHEDSCLCIAMQAANMIAEKGTLPREDLASAIRRDSSQCFPWDVG